MGLLGKILDLGMTKDWEEYQRVQLYRKIGKRLDDMSIEKLKELNFYRVQKANWASTNKRLKTISENILQQRLKRL